jgi:hypothetical protein
MIGTLHAALVCDCVLYDASFREGCKAMRASIVQGFPGMRRVLHYHKLFAEDLNAVGFRGIQGIGETHGPPILMQRANRFLVVVVVVIMMECNRITGGSGTTSRDVQCCCV